MSFNTNNVSSSDSSSNDLLKYTYTTVAGPLISSSSINSTSNSTPVLSLNIMNASNITNSASSSHSLNDTSSTSNSYYSKNSSSGTKLPSISTLLSSSNNATGTQSISPLLSTSPTLLSYPTYLRHHSSSFSQQQANAPLHRSDSLSSVDSYSRSSSFLYPTSSSLETLTNVAQQSFGAATSSAANIFNIPSKNTFSNSQYYSSSSSLGNNPYATNIQLDSSNIIPKFSTYEENEVSTTSSPDSISSSIKSNPSHGKKKRSNLPKQSTTILLNWLHNNLDHPYPDSKEKIDLMRKTGLTSQQLSNWFINARRRKMQSLKEIKSK